MTVRFPARIHVLLASQAPLGVVIRRGPSKRAAVMLWDRRCDDFRLGQWLKGRIYERRSDLSADGKYLIYFAMNGKWDSESGGAWTAVSRAPYLKALALFPKGDCWHGGGLWTGASDYWINDGSGHSVLRDTDEVRRDRRFEPAAHYGGECRGVYYPRLIRDGWRLTARVSVSQWNEKDIFEKDIGHGWRLRKIAHAGTDSPDGKGCYWDEHQLVHGGSGTETDCPDWEWAELDGRRLVWASGGRLFAGSVGPDGVAGTTELGDFNSLEFEPRKAPY